MPQGATSKKDMMSNSRRKARIHIGRPIWLCPQHFGNIIFAIYKINLTPYALGYFLFK